MQDNLDKSLVIITWKDHTAEGGWKDVEEFHAPAICHSVGWIWKEDDEGVTLVGGYSPDTSLKMATGNLAYILKSCITRRQALVEVKSLIEVKS